MLSVLLMILALGPVVSAGSASLPDDVDLTAILSMGSSLGTVSCEPGIPQAICSLEEGGFAVVTERPARLIFIDAAGNRAAEDFELPELFPRPRCLLSLSRGHLVIVDRGGALGEIDRRGRLVRKLPGLKTRWQPGALSLSPGGTGLLISDVYRGEVHRLDFDGNLQQSWTGFIDPRGIAVVGDKIWVSDRGYHRLFAIDLNQDSPAIEEGVGDHGAAPGLLAGPMGICGFGSRVLLVADRDNHRIQVFGSHGISMHHWGVHAMVPREASGRLHYPEALALDEASMICAVLEPSERRIQRFGVRDPELPVEAAEQWSRVDLVSHYGQHWAVESEGRLLAVSEPDSERVTVMARDPQSPFVLDEVGGNGALATQFRSPSGLDFMPARPFPRLVVADQGNHRLQMFEIRRNKRAILRREPWLMALVRTVDLSLLCEQTTGWQALLPPRPGAVACMEDGTIAVSDTANRRVLLLDDKFRPKGILVAEGLLEEATAIAADGAGILVADSSSCQVLRFLPEGGRPTRIESGAVVPVGVARHPDGSIWVTDAQRHALIRIGADGTEPQVILQGPGTGARQLFRPRSVQVSAKGLVWVLDHGNHRGVVLTPIEGEPLSTAAIRHFGSRPYLPVEVRPSPEEGER